MRITAFDGARSLAGVQFADFELPSLSVICGINGTGKTHFLESLMNGGTRLEAPGGAVRRVLLRSGDLTAPAPEHSGNASMTPQLRHEQFTEIGRVAQYGSRAENPDPTPEGRRAFQVNTADQTGVLRKDALLFMERKTGKTDLSFSVEDFAAFGPTVGDFDPFSASLTSLFASYRRAEHSNQFSEFLSTRGGPPALSPSDFLLAHGTPPWILVQEALDVLGLPFIVVPPPDKWLPDDGLGSYVTQFRTVSGVLIDPDQLSGGEKVFLRLLCRVFENNVDFAPRLPQVLLLDEVDSGLHPSLIAQLMRVLIQTFVERHQVNVVMTTHSPVTVTMAPAEALLEMTTSAPRLRKISQDRAVKSLTVGIPTLAVKVENTRQVVVESIYDQAVHQELYDVLKPRIDSPISLAFVPAGDTKIAGGKQRVRDLVNDFRQHGVSTARGLIDKDTRSSAPDFIEYVDDRYAIENIVLDPLQVAVFLLRERWKRPEFFGLEPGISELSLNSREAQQLVDVVCQRLGYSEPLAEVDYCGGFSLKVPVEVLTITGKVLAARLLEVLPELKRLADRKDYLWMIANKVSRDKPDYIPVVVLTAYAKLTQPDM